MQRMSMAFAPFLAGVLLAVVPQMATAADYPDRSITLVTPYGPGGAADISARLVGGIAPKYFGKPVVVVNKTGAAGVVGSSFVVNSPADGYTMLSARVGSQMGVPAMNKTIPYTWDQFTIIGLIETNPFVLVVNGKSGIKSFADFEKKIKDGAEMSYSSAGVGTLLHTGVAVMADAMGANFEKLIHVPYKGGGKAQAAVVAGEVDFSFQNLSAVAGAIQSGQLRALVVTTSQRQNIIKDVPTAKEVGYATLEKILGWSAIYGPPGLPGDVVAKWVDVLQKLKQDAAWTKQTTDLGNIVDVRSPAATKAFVAEQFKTFNETMKKLKMIIE